MGYRTRVFSLIPWKGGLNTSNDPSVIPHNQLVKAEQLIFDVNDARNMRDGINFNWDSSSASGGTNAESILGLVDYWYGSSGTKTNYLVGLGSSGNLYRWNKADGTRTLIPLNSTASSWPSVNTRCTFEVMNNSVIVAGDGIGNVPRQYIPFMSSSATNLDGNPPRMSFMREAFGRLFSNDKLFRDRVNYSPPGNPQTWGGIGDSGAVDLGTGDGDPVGLTAIMPPFQGALYIAKQTKLYGITGYTPETYQISTISDGIGCVSHNAAVAVDQDDVIFISENGVHSLLGTIQFGDVSEKYLSKDIQGSINSFWDRANLNKSWGCYLSQINSVAFTIPDTRYLPLSSNNSIWLYNITQKAWYTWPNIDCQCLITSYDNGKRRFYIGTKTGRVAKTLNGTNYDISTANAQTAITMTIKTGVIYIEGNPLVISAFKRFTLFWGPAGTVNVTVTIKIDNYSPQTLSFAQSSDNNVLGVSFVLGSSVLGLSVITGPYSQTIDGYGRSFQVTIEQTGKQAAVNIQGFAIEHEPLGPAQETITSG